MKKEKLKIQWGVLIPSVLLGVQICAAIFLLDYFYSDMHFYFESRMAYKEAWILQNVIDKMEQNNKYAKLELIWESGCAPRWHYKTVREILDYFDKTLCDVELILGGEFYTYVSGIKFEDSNSVVYYFCFKEPFNYWVSEGCLTIKQFFYQILNSKVNSIEAILPDGSSEICGNWFHCHCKCECDNANYSDLTLVAYKPFAYYRFRSRVTGKEYLLDISVLSDKEKKELGLAGKDLFVTRLLYFLFVGNPDEYRDENDFIIVSTAGEPDFCHSEELFSDYFCTSSKAESCPPF